MAGIIVRKAIKDDAQELSEIINTIIEIGGTTAYEHALSEAEFDDHFISGEGCLSCVVAVYENQLCGFQSLSRYKESDERWANIATFARVEPKVKGVGMALFEFTKELLKETDIKFINANIRADNTSGLSYYAKIGFTDYSISKAVPTSDGTLIDRIHKQFIM